MSFVTELLFGAMALAMAVIFATIAVAGVVAAFAIVPAIIDDMRRGPRR